MLTNAGSARRHEPELTDDDVKQLCEEFRGLYTLDDVNSFLDKKGLELSSKDWTRVLQRLIETDASRWLLVISEKLKDLASEEAALISTLVPFARAIGSKGTPEIIRENLKTIGLADPRLGLRLHLRISQTGEPLLIDWSGSLMSGYLIESPPEALKWLSQEFDKSTGPSAVALLRAVGSLKGSGVAKSYPEVFDLLRKATERERELQLAAIDAYFNLADSNPEESAKQLLDLSRKNDDEVKFGIARNLMVKQFPDPELEWGIIRVLAESDSAGVLSVMIHPISRHIPTHLPDVLGLFRLWFERHVYYGIQNVEWLFDVIGERDPNTALDIIERWIGQSDIVDFHIPKTLSRIFMKNARPLLPSLEKWLQESPELREIGLKTLKELLSDVFHKKGDRSIVDPSFATIGEAARKSGIDVSKAVGNLNDRTMQSLVLIHEIISPERPIDYDRVFRSLDRYPAFRDLIGRDWFNERRKENSNHGLLRLFAEAEIDWEKVKRQAELAKGEKEDFARAIRILSVKSRLSPAVYLENLNDLTSYIEPTEKGTKSIREKLKLEDEWLSAVSEIDLAGKLRSRKVDVELAPAINGDELDLRVRIDEEILVEVINPEMWTPLRVVSGALEVRNQTGPKFLREFDKHLKGKDLKVPVLMAVDSSRSELDEESVEDCLAGTPRFTFLVNKDTQEVKEGGWSRAPDSLGEKKPELNVISGAIIYRVAVDDDLQVRFHGRIIKNDRAINPIRDETVKKLTSAIFE